MPEPSLLCGLGLIAVGLARSGFDREHPRKDSIFYAMNADTGKAVWASFD